jgi:site-specific recombinase XerC
VLWRAGLRINEALSLTETDLDQHRGSILVAHGKGNRRREVGMDAWGWLAIERWVADRVQLPGAAGASSSRFVAVPGRPVGKRLDRSESLGRMGRPPPPPTP